MAKISNMSSRLVKKRQASKFDKFDHIAQCNCHMYVHA